MSKPKYHFFMIAGLVLFSFKRDDEEQISSVPVNALVRHTSANFTAAKLAKAQQNMHKNFLGKIPQELHASLEVNDIIINSVSNLGYMDEDEFQAPPEGMVLTEVSSPELDA